MLQPDMISHILAQGRFKSLFRFPRLYNNIMNVADNIMREEGFISYVNRELIAAYISKLNTDNYNYQKHLALAEEMGAQNPIRQLEKPEGRVKLFFEFAQKVAHKKVTQKDIRIAKNKGLKEGEILEIIHISALIGFFHRFANGYGLKSFIGNEFEEAMHHTDAL
ncbi:MAG: hypothetical protein AAFO07_23545 [Bacteroidota bacterium]